MSQNTANRRGAVARAQNSRNGTVTLQEPLKLKQACAVLNVQPKELQNFVQFGVLSPKMHNEMYFFGRETLYKAKVAFFLKKALGTSNQSLKVLLDENAQTFVGLDFQKPRCLVLTSHVAEIEEPVEVKVPFGRLVDELEERLSKIWLYRDLPRGRKREGWKEEFIATLTEAAEEMGDVSPDDLRNEIRAYRAKLRTRTSK